MFNDIPKSFSNLMLMPRLKICLILKIPGHIGFATDVLFTIYAYWSVLQATLQWDEPIKKAHKEGISFASSSYWLQLSHLHTTKRLISMSGFVKKNIQNIH